jgi:hypothetical protein
LKLAYLRAESGSAFEIYRAEFNVARSLWHAEKIDICSRDDHGVVLCHDVVYYGKVRTIVECDAFLAVVNVEIVCNHVLTRNKTIAVALNSYVSQYVVIVLIARKDESCSVAGIVQKLLAKDGITDVF